MNASGASLSTSRRLAFLTSTPHALKLLEPDQPPSETAAATTNVGRTGQFWSRRRRGRQGRAFGAPLRDLGALTALRRREVGLPSCRGSLSVTRSDVSDLAPLAQSEVSVSLPLQNAAKCFNLLQIASKPPMQINAFSCKKVLRNVAKCCFLLRSHLCIPQDATRVGRAYSRPSQFKHQFVPLWPDHRRPRCRDIRRCLQSWCSRPLLVSAVRVPAR